MKKLVSIGLVFSLALAMAATAFPVSGASVKTTSQQRATGLILDTTGVSRNDLDQESIDRLMAQMRQKAIDAGNADVATYAANGSLFPSRVDLSEDDAFPPIANQGGLGSCTTFATTYYQFTYAVNSDRNKIVSSQEEAYSPKWVYNTLNCGSPNNGTGFGECYNFLAEHGALLWRDFPYSGNKNIASSYAELPGETLKPQMRDALSLRLTSFADGDPYTTFSVSATGTPITSNTDGDLNNIKGFLSMKNVLTVGMAWDWDNMSVLKDENYHEDVICRVTTSSKAGAHALAVVGYDDNIWVDLNKNGICEPGEKGAFKLANSWGTDWGNNGFIWILYDTLNKVSAVTGWDSGMAATRQAAFSQGSSYSSFYMIYPAKKEVMLIADVTYQASQIASKSFTLGRTPTTASTDTVTRTAPWRIPRKNQELSDMFDFGSLAKPISSYMTGYTWSLKMPCSVISMKLTDNKGNLIHSMWYNSSSGNHQTSLDLQLGDVSYDGKADTADATLVLQCAAGTLEFSNLQKYLADVDHDGEITTADAVLIMNGNF